MVEIKEIFGESDLVGDIDICKSVKEFGEKIGEYPNSSTFLTIQDAVKSKSNIFIIENGEMLTQDIQRDFISE